MQNLQCVIVPSCQGSEDEFLGWSHAVTVYSGIVILSELDLNYQKLGADSEIHTLKRGTVHYKSHISENVFRVRDGVYIYLCK